MTDEALSAACKVAMTREAQHLMALLEVIKEAHPNFLPALLGTAFDMRRAVQDLKAVAGKINALDRNLVETSELCRVIWQDIQQMEKAIDALNCGLDEALNKLDSLKENVA